MVDCGTGGVRVVKSGAPTVVVDDKSVRTSFANLTAPSMLISPAPCSSMLKLARGCAVYIRIALTMLGVNVGLACRRRAAAPAATGVAIDEPFMYIIFRPSTGLTPASSDGFCVTR